MIICPECRAENADGVRFCDRCGQGLSATPVSRLMPSLSPLPNGTELKDGLRILELLIQTSDENRYRAERVDASGMAERFQVRERRSDHVDETPTPEAATGTEDASPESQPVPPSSSPTAKTAELKLQPSAASSLGSSDQVEALADPDQAGTSTIAPKDALPSLSTNGAAGVANHPDTDGQASPDAELNLTAESGANLTDAAAGTEASSATAPAESEVAQLADDVTPPGAPASDNLGEVFGRVLALSLTLNHPAFERALSGYAHGDRVYLIYRDEPITPLSLRPQGARMAEAEALAVAIQICQAVAFAHRRGLRVNDICPSSLGYGTDGRIHLTGLDRISNDDELQTDPLFNDGYTAPEIYKGRKADKRADLFAIGAVLYTCLTGDRLEAESWREEAWPDPFLPPPRGDANPRAGCTAGASIRPCGPLAQRRCVQSRTGAPWQRRDDPGWRHDRRRHGA